MFVFLVKAMNKPLSEIQNNRILFICKFNLQVKMFFGGATDNQIMDVARLLPVGCSVNYN